MKKTVKAWAITTKRGKIIGSNIELPPGGTIGGMTKYPAIYFLKVFAERRKSWIAEPDDYKVVPCQIIYEVP